MTEKRILIADSNSSSQTQIKDYLLAQDGISAVNTVQDGAAALTALHSSHYDVLRHIGAHTGWTAGKSACGNNIERAPQ